MIMTRFAVLLLLTAPLLTGCYKYTQAPGAVGKVVDANTGAPMRGASVTRPSVSGGLAGTPGVPSEGLPAATVTTDRSGRFNLPPSVHTQIAFMYLHNPPSISGFFLVTAPGYATNQVEGIATSHGLWRADLGQVLLSKP